MSQTYCGECNYFSHESIDGYGWCDVTQREQQCSDQCTLRYKTMTARQAETVVVLSPQEEKIVQKIDAKYEQ